MLLTRTVVLLAAVGALVAAFVTTGHGRHGSAAGADVRHADVRYVCPMHVEIARSGAGECPICGMPLVPHASAADATGLTALAGEPRLATTRVRSRLSSREIVAPAWADGPHSVSAALYDDEIAMLAPDQAADFVPAQEGDAAGARDAAAPARTAMRRVDGPPRRWDAATSVIRFEARPAKNPGAAYPPNQIGWLLLASPIRNVLVVPRASVLPSPAGPYLLVATEDLRIVSKRPVQIGHTIAGYATLVAGAREGERVVGADAFFADAAVRSAAGPAR